LSNPIPNPDYEHNPEGDHVVPLPSELEYLEPQGFRAVKYGNTVFLRGPGYDTKVIDELLSKINNQESLVIAVTGPPGAGKTYLGMGLARILDPKFHCTDTPPPPPEQDHGQIPFTREHLMYLTGANSPLKRGQVIEPDESHFGIGARGWANRDQQELTNYIAAIRSKGYVLILIVLHTEMIDKMVRDFVINYEIHVTNRGEGIVYRRWFPQFSKKVYKKRLGKIRLPLPDHEICNYPSCLKCTKLNPDDITKRCPTLRAIYERRKEWFLNEQSKQDEEAEETEPKTLEDIKEEEDRIMKQFYKHQDLLELNSRGTTAPDSIKNCLRAMGEKDTREQVRKYKRKLDRDKELLKNIALRDHPPKEYPEDVSLA
jgi:hypothetical protein